MADADRHTITSGLFDGPRLMENAGAAVMDVILQDFGSVGHVHIVCGPGNNGGDGYVVARLLRDRGHPVSVYAFAAPKNGTDAQQAAHRWLGPVLPIADFAPNRADLVVDAVFGAGARGALPEPIEQLLVRASGEGARLLAVDLPSGVGGDTGHATLDIVYDATVTFYRKKPGHLLEPGRSLCGALHVADIGVRAAPHEGSDANVFENHPLLWQDCLRAADPAAHKYQKGHVAVFSGPSLATGAARLSAQAAQAAGVGAVTLMGTREALQVHAAHVTSVMLKPYVDPAGALAALSDVQKCSAAVLGPGFSDFETARKIALGLLQSETPSLVLDADGLTAFRDKPDALFQAAAGSPDRLVLTPHEGEFARLFPDLAADDSISKLEKARRAAARAHAVIIYKGRDTVIAAPPRPGTTQGRAVINAYGPPSLATAGSGDVLAGLVAGLLARSVPTFEAAASAVWLHGDAGYRAGVVATAEDFVTQLRDGVAAALLEQ
ncbi:MAG: NAD(P)H-hydrate dehydratase [Pseudomonadota bacterium]